MYEIAFVMPGGRVVEKKRQGCPAESWMIANGQARRAGFAIRYYPSRKGWRLLDIRGVTSFEAPGARYRIYKGQVRGARYWPTKDAAIMVAIQKLSGHSSTV